MSWILVERDKPSHDEGRLREGMRRSMGGRGPERPDEGRGGWRDGYRRGYEHGWEDKAEEERSRRDEDGERPRRYI